MSFFESIKKSFRLSPGKAYLCRLKMRIFFLENLKTSIPLNPSHLDSAVSCQKLVWVGFIKIILGFLEVP